MLCPRVSINKSRSLYSTFSIYCRVPVMLTSLNNSVCTSSDPLSLLDALCIFH